MQKEPSYPVFVASYDTRAGNDMGLFCSSRAHMEQACCFVAAAQIQGGPQIIKIV